MRAWLAGKADRVIDAAVRLAGLERASPLSVRLAERIAPVHSGEYHGQHVRVSCPNWMTYWRARTLLTKEPDTIAWIESFEKGDVLFDVGANIGLYSIFAAKRGHTVVAFEPEAANYAELCRNLSLNALDQRVTCFPIALSDRYGADSLYLSRLGAGMALNTVGAAVDWRHAPFTPAFTQSVLRYSLDQAVSDFTLSFPTHLKIDVDGAEGSVLAGAMNTIRDPRLQSILIELNEALPDDRIALDRVLGAGFGVDRRTESAPAGAPAEQQTVYNYLLRRCAA